MKKAVFLLSILAAFFSSCTTEPDLTDTPDISFSNDVQRILSANCNFEGCHGGSGGNGDGEFRLDSYNAVMGYIKAGNARGSKLYQVITRRGLVEERMPPEGFDHVPDEDVKRIYLWIEQGAKNN